MVRPRSLVVACFVFLFSTALLHAGDLRIPLPKRSKYTPVQALNRDGVKAVEKHQYERAKKLFYKAYLIDPNDPFTLNNLGYMAELDGDADRARRYYSLAAEMGSDAIIDKANNQALEGKPVSAVAGVAEDKGIKINRLNNQAIALLEKGRAPEADLVLQKALTVDPRNPFTLNNLGYAKEKEGELQAAYQFYTAAANRDSQEKVEVAIDKSWRGRDISDVARDNARKLNRELRHGDDKEAQVAILNLRGVSALNRNDRRAGREFIQKAFKLAPNDAFTLNNMGYLAEMDGDRETADFYYERAREANQAKARIAVATRKDVEGKRIGDVADNTDQLVEAKMEEVREAREREGGPVILMHRDNSAVVEPAKPVYTPPAQRVSNDNGELMLPAPAPVTMSSTPTYKERNPGANGVIQPLPSGNEQPTTVKEGQGNNGVLMPLPDNDQPSGQPNSAQPGASEGSSYGGLLPPPDDDVRSGQPVQPQVREGQHDGGMVMPLPDDKQPAPQPQSQPVQPAPQPQVQQAPTQQTPAPQQQPQSQPGLLLPPPDKQQQHTTPQQPAQTVPQANAIGSAPVPQSNTGVYAPPPASSNPGNYSNSNAQTAPPPAHISDEDQPKPKAKQNTQPQNGTAPKKISDQN